MNATKAIKAIPSRFGRCALAVLLVGEVQAATVTQDGTCLTIDVPAVETYTYAEALPDGVEEIRKTGAGTCDFGVTPYRTFTGTIRVEAGVLTGDPGVGVTGAFGTPAAIHVSDGARFKILNTWKGSGNKAFEGTATSDDPNIPSPHTPLWKTHLYVRGAGPDGQGAVWHMATLSSHNAFGNVTLEGDTTFYTEKRWGLGGAANVLDMGGHTLSLKGSDQFELGRPVTKVRNPGDVRLESGSILFENGGRPGQTSSLGLVLEDGTIGALAERTLYAASGTAICVYKAGCPLNVHGTGTSGTVLLKLGYEEFNAAEDRLGYLLGDLTADPGVELCVTYGQQKAYGGEIRGRIEAETLSVNRNITLGNDYRAILGGAQKGVALTNLWVWNDALRLVDAGVVTIAGVTGREAWADNVPTAATMPVRVGLGCGNVKPAYLSVEGATTLKAAVDTPADTLAPLYVRMVGTGGWDFGLFEVKDGGTAYADFFIGTGNTQGGAVYLSGEASRLISRGSIRSRNWFGRLAAYATLDMRGGTHESGGFTCFGENGRGFFMQRGGTVRYGNSSTKGQLRLARRLGGVAHYVGLGGTFGAGPDGGLADVDLGFCDSFQDSDGYEAVFTVGGTCTAAVDRVLAWMVTNKTTLAATTALVNLNGQGLLACRALQRTCVGATSVSAIQAIKDRGGLGESKFYVNFDGGTLRATQDESAFFGTGLLAPDRVTVFAGGARLDTDGHAVTVGSAFEKPYGKGIASVAFTDGEGVTPLGTRRFRVTGTGGAAAAVLTDFDAATRTDGANALVCSPGFGYGDDVAVALERVKAYTGVGETLDAAVTLVDYDAAVYVGGGLTKLGAGTLTLTAANTYAGATRVEAGTLALSHADGFPGGDVEFPAAALLSDAPPSLVAQRLVLRPGAKIRVTGAEILRTAAPVRFRPVVTVETPLAALPEIAFVDSDGKPVEDLPAAWSFRLSKGGTVLSFGFRTGLLLLVR